LFNEKLKKVAEDVNAEDGEALGVAEVEVGAVHVSVGDGEEFTEDQPCLVQRAHPRVEVVSGKADLKTVFVLRVRRDSGEVAGNGFAGGGKEVMEFGGNEVLPVVVGFGVGNGGVGKETVADAGCVALGEDVREILETVEENGVETAETQALGAVGLDVKMFHSDFSM